jgi:biotin carboxyl carrier protein
VREESHLEEMRSAIRGDFERLADRRGDQELMRVVDDEPQPQPQPQPEPEPEPEQPLEQPPEPEPETEPQPEEQQRSWLARLFSPPQEPDSE